MMNMVDTKKVKLEGEIQVDIPLDIIEDEQRLKAIVNGLVQTISRALYEQGVSFHITKIKFKT
jgi:hypothetical protein